MSGREKDSPEALAAAAKAAAESGSWWTFTSADYYMAGSKYEQAAKGFFAKGDYQSAYKCWQEAARNRDSDGDTFGSGRSWEEAAKLGSDKLKKWQDAVKHLDHAVEKYRSARKDEASCRASLRKIDILEKHSAGARDMEEAFQSAIEVHEDFEKWYPLGDLLTRFENFLTLRLVSSKDSSVETIYKVLDRHVVVQANLKSGAMVQLMSKVVVCLALTQDIVRVKQFLDEATNWDNSLLRGPNFLDISRRMLEAYEDRDVEALDKIKRRQTMTMLPLEICKLAQKMTMVGGGKVDAALADFVDSKGAAVLGDGGQSGTDEEGLPDLS
ncbi:unnamed protein product [Amoebophrya sp. A25]|nr:unnamed protein product [Amoebophrya sp. A25]|eukprot:GSA25T00017534001.1